MKFFIGIVPPENIYKTVVDIQSLFGSNRLEPHITLRPPVNVLHENKWLEAIGHVCTNFPPFTIHLPGTGYFGNRVLYISVELPQLTELHYAIMRVINPFEQVDNKGGENQQFHPHLTLGRQWCGFTKQDFVQMKALADGFLSANQVYFIATSIRIYHKPKQHGQWKPMKDIFLNPGSES